MTVQLRNRFVDKNPVNQWGNSIGFYRSQSLTHTVIIIIIR